MDNQPSTGHNKFHGWNVVSMSKACARTIIFTRFQNVFPRARMGVVTILRNRGSTGVLRIVQKPF